MSQYKIYITPQAFQEMKNLPGKIRQRVRNTIDALANETQPARSKQLNLSIESYVVFRVRIDNWRIVYSVDFENKTIDILTVRKRPPYDYGDLADLLSQLD
ncbi:MAG: hypothetical protein OHK0052_09990 [Anaerolineales bacterium]